MKTFKKAIVVVMLALSALPAFAQDIPTDPDGDGLPTGRDLCPLAYGEGSDGCPSGNYASRPQPTLPGTLVCPDGTTPPCWMVIAPLAAEEDTSSRLASGGVIVVMGDGSVKFLKDSINGGWR